MFEAGIPGRVRVSPARSPGAPGEDQAPEARLAGEPPCRQPGPGVPAVEGPAATGEGASS